jgi:hypothetical protein
MRSAFQDGLIEETLAAFARTLPLGRVTEPEDVAAVALFLASNAAKHMTGTVLPVDGGVTARYRRPWCPVCLRKRRDTMSWLSLPMVGNVNAGPCDRPRLGGTAV